MAEYVIAEKAAIIVSGSSKEGPKRSKILGPGEVVTEQDFGGDKEAFELHKKKKRIVAKEVSEVVKEKSEDKKAGAQPK